MQEKQEKTTPLKSSKNKTMDLSMRLVQMIFPHTCVIGVNVESGSGVVVQVGVGMYVDVVPWT
eukprot:2385304-Ditylum_brightwellii.AAC.1